MVGSSACERAQDKRAEVERTGSRGQAGRRGGGPPFVVAVGKHPASGVRANIEINEKNETEPNPEKREAAACG